MQQLEYQTFHMTKDEFFYSFQQQTENEKKRVFLESGRGGQYSIAAWDPIAIAKSFEEGLHISWQNGEVEVKQGEALEQLEKLVKQYQLPSSEQLPDFQGGAIGFISYDYARTIEVLPKLTLDDLQVPAIYFYLFDYWAVHNVKTNEVTLMKFEECAVDLSVWQQQWEQGAVRGLAKRNFHQEKAADVQQDESELQVSFEGAAFESAVEKIKAYIEQGDVFQVNLSVRQGKRLSAPPLAMYEAVRSFNPSPYMAYIESEDFAVVSGSPELLVKRKGTELSTRPIAGTRPRGESKEQDIALANELIHHEKERAEHVMLVDLERNDLGRVCQYGTVEVDEFMVIEYYSHVMHIVSNVRGQIATGKTNTDVIRAMFPGGTITGAPKIRTMEIIEELEPVRRGLYTGSIGWIGYTGDLELNIVIRTAYIKDGIAYIQAGAGIVIDSVPENEYVESMNKAKAMWQAKAMAEGVVR
ncbi:aminodeoxychorismate synthase component I [Lysinibacillus sp. 2017]|uniref:anthranilate synthase component I family protein n=1 Tax=unclassified Lysinibacillus TaxID=2636778 RepID=UPI000D529DAF|nr:MULTISPECIES: anthranilate synthase component I family protein [unclassified Lysinibacillus]AWE05973.1 aminodeoxychorismate synthase component I [Lysinibacillus sp. 2017]TGN33467.1 anthranilate synthase component I family protein [Lysinibacillus sp. S2017]